MNQLAPNEAGTVPVRVQIVDVDAFAIDLVVPTFIAARDLTQRIARDANLGAFWPDGTRRAFWLRARGRLLAEHEKLQDLGVVAGELLHLLPQPPEGAEVVERPPEYPPARGYAAAGIPNIALALFGVLLWVALWSLGLTYSMSVWTGLLPGLGLGLTCTALARHIWGGDGSAIRIPLTGFVVFVPFLIIAPVPAVVWAFMDGGSPDWTALVLCMISAFMAGVIGVGTAWLAWFGAVEPLPKQKKVVIDQAAMVAQCGVCGQAVELNNAELRADCMFGCGRVFHTGCYKARQSVHTGSGCAICGFQPAGAPAS